MPHALSVPNGSFRAEDVHEEKLKVFPANSGLNIIKKWEYKNHNLVLQIMHCMIQMRQSVPALGT